MLGKVLPSRKTAIHDNMHFGKRWKSLLLPISRVQMLWDRSNRLSSGVNSRFHTGPLCSLLQKRKGKNSLPSTSIH